MLVVAVLVHPSSGWLDCSGVSMGPDQQFIPPLERFSGCDAVNKNNIMHIGVKATPTMTGGLVVEMGRKLCVVR